MEEMSREERGLKSFTAPKEPKESKFMTDVENFAANVSKFESIQMEQTLDIIEKKLRVLDNIKNPDLQIQDRLLNAYETIEKYFDSIDPIQDDGVEVEEPQIHVI